MAKTKICICINLKKWERGFVRHIRKSSVRAIWDKARYRADFARWDI